MLTCFLATLTTTPASARPRPHPRVQLRIDDCSDITPAAVREIVAVELGALLVMEGEAAADTARVAVRCTQDGAELSVFDPITDKSLSRTVALYSVAPSARTRLLALSVAELVAASWVELETNPTPAIPPVGNAAPLAARDAVRLSLRQHEAVTPYGRFSLSAVGSVQGFFSAGALYGGGLRLSFSQRYYLGFAIDFLAQHGNASAALGEIGIDSLSGSALFLLARYWSRIGVRGGVGLRVGAVQFKGTAFDPTTTRSANLWGAWLGPMGQVGLSVLAARRLSIGIDGELGDAVLPVRALSNGKQVAALSGPWLGVQLALSLYL
jgi:hypothetical protein